MSHPPLDLQATPVGMATWKLDLLQENMVQLRRRVITQNDRAANLLKQQVSEDVRFIASRHDMKILELKLAIMHRQKADLHRRIHEMKLARMRRQVVDLHRRIHEIRKRL